MLTLGVVADTHVPDRARSLNPKISSVFEEAQVAAILHAGDICSPEVLEQLRKTAPVYAVQGNRDLWQLSHLPTKITLEFAGVPVGLTHGHGGLFNYFSQKLSYLINGYQILHYEEHLRKEFPFARIIIFGHTHRSENTWKDDVLIFNPGPASYLSWGFIPPSIGLLHFFENGKIKGEIVPLEPHKNEPG